MAILATRLTLLSCAIAIASVGCTKAQVLRGSELEKVPALVHVGDTVRTTTAAGVTQEFKVVALEDGGTLRGATSEGSPVAVQAGDLAALEYRSPAPRRTVWMIIGAVLGVGLVSAYDSCKPDGPYGKPACAD
jgi:hypothetical protein